MAAKTCVSAVSGRFAPRRGAGLVKVLGFETSQVPARIAGADITRLARLLVRMLREQAFGPSRELDPDAQVGDLTPAGANEADQGRAQVELFQAALFALRMPVHEPVLVLKLPRGANCPSVPSWFPYTVVFYDMVRICWAAHDVRIYWAAHDESRHLMVIRSTYVYRTAPRA